MRVLYTAVDASLRCSFDDILDFRSVNIGFWNGSE
jgi:hypothetical protein